MRFEQFDLTVAERRTHNNLCHEKRATIVTFVSGPDITLSPEGTIESKYWGALPSLLRQEGFTLDWIWLYFDSNHNTYKETALLRSRLNQTNIREETVYLIEDGLNIKTAVTALYVYLSQLTLSVRLRLKTHLFNQSQLRNSDINFSHLFSGNLSNMFLRKRVMRGIIESLLIDNILKMIPKSKVGFFLYEGQSWEKSFSTSWRSNHNGKLLGVLSNIARPFDFRAYQDPRVFHMGAPEQLTLPDLLVCNGHHAYSLLKQNGYPASSLVSAEALRYMHLTNLHGRVPPRILNTKRTLLVIGDNLLARNEPMLALLRETFNDELLDIYSEIWIKEHPDCPLPNSLTNQLAFNFKVTAEPLNNLWAEVDVVFCPNSTSVSIESIWIGIPTIILRDLRNINLNPLIHCSNVSFVSTARDLQNNLQNPVIATLPKDVFYLDEEYSRWKRIIRQLSGSTMNDEI